MANCLVTGGAGFIGSHLVEALVAEGHRVRVLDNFDTGRRDKLRAVQDRVEIIEGSVTDPAAVQQVMKGVHWVFHLAALASVQRSVDDPFAAHEVCSTGTLYVLNAARQQGVKRVVYAGSCSCYGDLSGGARVEGDPLRPLSPYAAAKLAGEHYCTSFGAVYGLETVRLRFFNVYGPRQDASSPYSGVIALFIAALKAGRQPTIYGDGLQSRDFVYIADVVRSLRRAAEAPAAAGNVYHIGTGRSSTILQLLDHLNKVMDTNIKPIHAPPRPGDLRESRADIAHARRDLDYEPRVSFLEGLGLTIAGVGVGVRG